MKCNLIIPGFPKCGTTSLHMYLDLHPYICMSKNKEPHFFSHNDYYSLGTKWYDTLFDQSKGTGGIKYFGEASTSYCYDEIALKRIKSRIEEPKIIILMRDPLNRLVSHYNWLWANYLESRPLLQAIYEEKNKGYDVHKSFNNSGTYATYLRGSNYSTFIPLIEDILGQDRILCIKSESLLKKPSDILSKCFAFLGLESIKINKNISANKTRNVKVPIKLDSTIIHSKLPQLFDLIDPSHCLRRKISSKFVRKGRRSPEISATELQEITRILKPDSDFYQSKL